VVLRKDGLLQKLGKGQISPGTTEMLYKGVMAGADLPFCKAGEGTTGDMSVSMCVPFPEASFMLSLCAPFGRSSNAGGDARSLPCSRVSWVTPFTV
jgi:hypothetical protein